VRKPVDKTVYTVVIFSEQCAVYYVGLVPSQFYNFIGQNDVRSFYGILILAVSLIFAVAVVSLYIYSVLFV
jgi:hypothetical protein